MHRNADLAALGLVLGPQHPQSAPVPTLETHGKEARDKERQQQQEEEGEGHDEMLLAFIGILYAARLQSSIAGWVRAGVRLQSWPQLERGAERFDDPVLMHEWACHGSRGDA